MPLKRAAQFAFCATVFVAFLLWLVAGGPQMENPVAPGAAVNQEKSKSDDLTQDLQWMWETRAVKGSAPNAHDTGQHFVSTERSIAAAQRVFNTVDLAGKTREQVIAMLGDPKRANASVYNFPFYPVANGEMVYRFDNGAWGVQFDVAFDTDGKVCEVLERGIE